LKYLNALGRGFFDFFRDGGLMLAGSLSYFIVTALIPFCLFLLTLFGYIIGHYPEFQKFFLVKLTGFFPSATSDITHAILRLTEYKGPGKIGLVIYGFMSYQAFASLENSLNAVFRVKKRRRIFYSFLLSLVVVTCIIVLLIVSFIAASVIPLLNLAKPYLPENVRIGRVTAFIIQFVLPFVLVLFSATMVYKLLPMAKVKMTEAFGGAVFTSVFLELAKHLFTWYVAAFAHLGRIYGSLTAFIFFLLWMFYSACIFLIGAEMVRNLGRPAKSRGRA